MIRTMLEVKHYSKRGLLQPDSYRGWSRSYTKRFIEALYLSHANILTATPYNVADVMGSTTRAVDCDSYNGASVIKANMQVVGPAGNGIVLAQAGSISAYSSGYFPFYDLGTILAGHQIGIVIGRSDTPVTPTDSLLADRIHHGVRGSVAGPATAIEALTGDNADYSFQYNNGCGGILIRPLRSCLMSAIQFKVWRTGSPGTSIVAYVYGINGNYYVYSDATLLATSSAVNGNLWGASSPGAYATWSFSPGVYLQAGFPYWIFVSPTQASSSNYINFRYVNSLQAGHYTQCYLNSAWSSSSQLWLNQAAPLVFEIDGSAGAEMEHGGTDVYGMSVSNPNASFTLRRIFMNNSGESITVKEAGIYMPLTRYTVQSSNTNDWQSFVVCAARDTFAGIAVGSGESIEVTYTPQITV